MNKILIPIVLVLSLGLAGIFYLAPSSQEVSNEDLNIRFESVLNGREQLTDEILNQIYQSYVSQVRLTTLNEAVLRANLKNTVEQIAAHNANSSSSYKKGLNQYSHMSDEEFMDYFNLDLPQECSATKNGALMKSTTAPDSWDWREHGGASPVKNQGGCGSCWTFSTVGTLESHTMIKLNKLLDLSEQQLVDCAGDFDNYGCRGGLPSHAFEYIKQAGGISTEVGYPYYAIDRPCTVQSSTFALQVSGGSVNITSGDELAMKDAVFTHGPVSIAFQVVSDFRNYLSGVYTSSACKNSEADVNHAVVAVGYGNEDGRDYWLVKNSWGANWGMQGYFKIDRGVNMCGVAVCNSYPQDINLVQR